MGCGDGLFFSAGLTVQVAAVGDASRAATVMFAVASGVQGLCPLANATFCTLSVYSLIYTCTSQPFTKH